MRRKLLVSVAPLIAIAALGSMAGVAHAVEPTWFQKGLELPKIGEPVTLVNSKSVFGVFWEGGLVRFKCKVLDKEKIWNPEPFNTPGRDEITEATFPKCAQDKRRYDPCSGHHERLEMEALGLPWASVLISGAPIRDEITGVKLRAHCSVSAFEETYKGTLTPAVRVNELSFLGPASGELEESGSGHKILILGEDKLHAPGGKIEAEE